MHPYSVHSSLLPRCVDAPQVEVPNLHCLVNTLMKSMSEKDEYKNLCKIWETYLSFPFVVCFLLFYSQLLVLVLM